MPCERLVAELEAGRVEQAVALVPAQTREEWFQALASVAAAICFPSGGVQWWHPARPGRPMHGDSHVVLYLGKNVEEFRREFKEFGVVFVAAAKDPPAAAGKRMGARRRK